MRILYLHQYFTTPDHSGGTRSFEMARRLVAQGHDVTLLTSSAFLDESWAPTRGWHVRECEGIRVEVLHLPYSNKDAFSKRIRTFFRFMQACRARAASIDTDVVFATSTPLTIAIPGAHAAARRRVPLVFEVRDLWPELPIAIGALRNPVAIAAARRLERFAYRRSSHVVALSPGMADGVAATGFPRERIDVIPNSCDRGLFNASAEDAATFRKERAWLGDRPLVVYTGTLGKINGVGWLVDVAAAALERDSELRFLIVGDGMERAEIEARAREAGVLERNLFLSAPLPKRQIPALLRAADVATSLFVPLPAMEHNSANKFFDALASGTPVAINYGGWQADVIAETGCGLRLRADDPAEAAGQLSDAVRDRSRLEAMGVAARELAASRFDRDHLARQLEAVLVQAVERGQ